MFSKLFFILITTVSVTAFGNQLRIMPLGDSITEGGYTINSVYHDGEGGYRFWLEQQILPDHPEILFVGSLSNGPDSMAQKNHEGHAGWKVGQISENIVSWLQASKPDIILLMIGTNNMWNLEDRVAAPEAFNQLLGKIWETLPDVKILVASIIDTNNSETNGFIKIYNLAIKEIVKVKKHDKEPVVWVDMNKQAHLKKNDLVDGVHPSPDGYKKIAQVWADSLKMAVTR